MKISVILAHPNKGSFNHAIADVAVNYLKGAGHEVNFHDLYDEGFVSVITYEEIPKGAELDPMISKHCREISEAEGIVIVHPNWWGQPPAILKGWIDRVVRPGVAYEFNDDGEGVPVGLLQAKAALVFNTSNTPEERERKIFGDPLETIWKNCVFDFCGVKKFNRKTFSIVVTSTEEQRKQWLSEVSEIVRQYFPSK